MTTPTPPADPAPAVQRFVLEVRALDGGRSWRATLQRDPAGGRVEFDSPLALLRYLARLAPIDRRGGLR